MARRGSKSDNTKRIALGVLGGILVVAIVYQLFFSGPAPRPRVNPQGGVTATNTPQPPATAPVQQSRRLGSAAQEEARVQELLSDLTPLNPRLLSVAGGASAPGQRGNIFAYYVEPPKPPPPKPLPPPIQLVSVQPPTAVAGTPRNVTLIVSGNKIPADAQILLDGAPKPTKRLGETQLSTEITAAEYGYARGINIQVKSQSNPSVDFSNVIQFIVQPAPEPQFIYKGRLGSLNQPQSNYAVFEMTGTREIKRAKVGETIMGTWRIDAISADAVDLTHTQYGIKRRVPLQDKAR